MSLAIRLSRGGSKKRPYYRIVVADSRSPRDGRFIERLGSYNPLLAKDDEKRVVLDSDRARHWLDVGAQPSDRVARFLDAVGVRERAARNNPNRAKPGEKATERAEERVSKAEAAAEAARELANAPAPEPESETVSVEASVEAEAPAAEAESEAPVVEPEAPAEESDAAENGDQADTNESTPIADAGDTAETTTGESSQENVEG